MNTWTPWTDFSAVSPCRLETRRDIQGRSEIRTGTRHLGYVRKVGKFWAIETDYFEGLVRRQKIHRQDFRTKTDAVRWVIDQAGASFWCYYGESWEEHCERIQG